MSAVTKTCRNCDYREGTGTYARCARTACYLSTELTYGGRCTGPRNGVPEMNLWEPRRTLWTRIISILTGARHGE